MVTLNSLLCVFVCCVIPVAPALCPTQPSLVVASLAPEHCSEEHQCVVFWACVETQIYCHRLDMPGGKIEDKFCVL